MLSLNIFQSMDSTIWNCSKSTATPLGYVHSHPPELEAAVFVSSPFPATHVSLPQEQMTPGGIAAASVNVPQKTTKVSSQNLVNQ